MYRIPGYRYKVPNIKVPNHRDPPNPGQGLPQGRRPSRGQYSCCVSFLTVDGQCSGSPGTGTKFLISKFLIKETLHIRAQGCLRGAAHPGVSTALAFHFLLLTVSEPDTRDVLFRTSISSAASAAPPPTPPIQVSVQLSPDCIAALFSVFRIRIHIL